MIRIIISIKKIFVSKLQNYKKMDAEDKGPNDDPNDANKIKNEGLIFVFS